MDISQLKREAGVKACQMVEDGMTLGVGTGSTVAYFIEELGRRHREEGLQAHCVPTSIRSAEALRKAGTGFGLHSRIGKAYRLYIIVLWL